MSMLFRDLAGPCLTPQGSVACIGAFDGVHRGHRALLDRVRERAGALGLAAVAVSFEPLPREFFARPAGLPRLANARDKIEQFDAAGMSTIGLLRFNASLAAQSAQSFVDRVLVDRLCAREVWVGPGFRFGHARAGDIDFLRALGVARGFSAQTIEPIEMDGARVSSSRIRSLLAAGDFVAGARLLGRRFAIGGHVVRGNQLGRKLGFPTANLRLGRRVAPVGGIFAVWVRGVGSQPMPAVASLGVRPTVGGREPLLEAHLFDFDGDLYGRRIGVEFVAKLRDEARFADLDSLVAQMNIDAADARAVLDVTKAGV